MLRGKHSMILWLHLSPLVSLGPWTVNFTSASLFCLCVCVCVCVCVSFLGWSQIARGSWLGNSLSHPNFPAMSPTQIRIWRELSTHWKRPWCWERLKAGGEVGDRGWDGWMASPIQWTWVWANFGRYSRTGKSGVLQFMELQSQTQLSDLNNRLWWNSFSLGHIFLGNKLLSYIAKGLFFLPLLEAEGDFSPITENLVELPEVKTHKTQGD